MDLIDSHCHLNFEVLEEQLPDVIARAQASNVQKMVTISTRIKQFDSLKAIVEAYPQVYCSIGTHPHQADEELDVSVKEIISLSEHPKCVGIGEAGLDYFYKKSSPEGQAQGLRNHIAAARETGLPLIIHNRDSDQDMISILKDEYEKGAFPFVLHCFSSSLELAKQGLALGGYISFSGIVTFNSAKELQEIAKVIPDDRILVETDAPYLAPTPHRGKTNEPGFVIHTAEKLSLLRETTLEHVADVTTENFYRVFQKVPRT